MSTFGSSVINKSNKKYAPKAPQRKRPVATSSQTSTPTATQEYLSAAATLATTHVKDVSAPQLRADARETENVQAQPRQVSGVEETERPSKRRRIEGLTPVIAVGPEEVAQAARAEPESAVSVMPKGESRIFDILEPSFQYNEQQHERVSEVRLPAEHSVSESAGSVQLPDDGIGGKVALALEASPTLQARDEDSARRVVESSHEDMAIPDTTATDAQGPVREDPSELKTADVTVEVRIDDSAHVLPTDVASTDGLAEEAPNPGSTIQPQMEVETVVTSTPETSSHYSAPTATMSTRIQRQPRKSAATVRADAEVESNTSQAPAKKPRRPRKKADQALVADMGIGNDATSIQPTPAPKKPRKPRKKAISQPVVGDAAAAGSMAPNDFAEPTNAEPVADIETAAGTDVTPDESTGSTVQKRRKRAATPQGAEDAEIDPETVTMSDLTRDNRRGRKSQRETELENIDWTEVARRRKEAEARQKAGIVDEEAKQEQERTEQEADRAREGPRGPQLRIVNGQVVLDADSLVINRNAGLEDVSGEAIEENDLTRRINSQTWLYDNRRDPGERFRSSAKSDPWSEAQTDEFYAALRMFGTDFFIISKMFPPKTRRQIKLKFTREERADPDRVKAALIGENVPMDLSTYAAKSGREESEFKDPVELEAELRLQDEQQKEEIEKQKEEQLENAKRKQEAAKARAEGKKMKKGQGKRAKGKEGAAAGVEVEVDAAGGGDGFGGEEG